MRFPAMTAIRSTRIWFVALLAGASFGAAAPAVAAAEEFGVVPFSFQAGACNNANPEEGCTTPATQAGAHPVFSITTFKLNANAGGEPVVPLKRVRVDSPPGLIVNPNAVPRCTEKQLKKEEENAEGKKECLPTSQMGVEIAKFYNPIKKEDETEKYPVYNMVPPAGSPADFAYLTPTGVVNVVGGVSWHSEASVKGAPTGDSHLYFTISNIFEPAPLVESTLVFLSAPNSTFLTVPTSRLGPATNYLEVESYGGEIKNYSFTPAPPLVNPALETIGCEKVPFEPGLTLSPETKQSDSPDGATVELSVPQKQEPLGLASAHLKTAKVTLPEGLTLNPSAASQLDGCTPEQIAVGTNNKIECPALSVIGTAVVKGPAILPADPTQPGEGELTGDIYLGKPASGSITGPPYTIYVAAESSQYGLGIRLKGTVEPNRHHGSTRDDV